MTLKNSSPKVIIAIVSFLIIVCLGAWVPTTTQYKSFVRALWHAHHLEVLHIVNIHDPQLAVVMGNYYFGGGIYDLQSAKERYTEALSIDPKVKLAHYQLARIYFVQNRLDTALLHINQEINNDPYNLRSLYVRGLIRISQGDLEGAESDFARFVAYAPGEWGGYNDLAFVLAKRGKYTESEKVLAQAFEKIPDSQENPWLWNSLGVAQLNQGAFTKAVASFGEAKRTVASATLEDWRRAYSGNDPRADAESLKSFQQVIMRNLQAAQRGATMKP